jgi:hypothetical protein
MLPLISGRSTFDLVAGQDKSNEPGSEYSRKGSCTLWVKPDNILILRSPKIEWIIRDKASGSDCLCVVAFREWGMESVVNYSILEIRILT